MDSKENSRKVFEDQMRRIQEAAGTRTQANLADFLGIRQTSVSDAKRRGKIPAEWLVILMRVKQVLPEWILTGQGPCYTVALTGRYETGIEAAERWADEKALQRLPSRMPADELVRRIAVSQKKSYCSEMDE